MKGFLWGLLKISLLCLIGLVAWATYPEISPETRWGIAILFIGLAIGYEINTIKEKLDEISSKLDDIRNPGHDFDA